MSKITLLRHAAVPVEYQKRYIGYDSDIGLDMQLFEHSKIEELLSKQNFDLIYTSDLKRCVDTVKHISDEYICDNRLREMKFKKNIEGKSFEEVEQNDDYKQEYLENINTWYSYICEEPIESFEQRIKEFLNSLPKNKKILICTHGGTMRMLHSLLMNKDYTDFLFKIDYLDAFNYNLDLYLNHKFI
ncbi:histidine phosphatase family protein [Halarcobacter sp.]|uniref:histidine phosphatase family protein n=1 Tax=Halarcobacter sp. TaxID=2321133 RepID=UPI002AA740B1|nr:histidine phosphatase family protein [Halarcobacter sp.]